MRDILGGRAGEGFISISDQQSLSIARRIIKYKEAYMKDFRQLKVWEKAHHLALEVYKATATFQRKNSMV